MVSQSSQASAPKKLRAIVAEDDPAVRRAISWLLRSSCEVIPCMASGPELADIAAASQPDVIICDAMMPPFFGCEAIPPLCEYAFVLLSDIQADIRHWIDHGGCCVVHPMDLDADLELAVAAAAAGRVHISRRALQAASEAHRGDRPPD